MTFLKTPVSSLVLFRLCKRKTSYLEIVPGCALSWDILRFFLEMKTTERAKSTWSGTLSYELQIKQSQSWKLSAILKKLVSRYRIVPVSRNHPSTTDKQTIKKICYYLERGGVTSNYSSGSGSEPIHCLLT